MWEAGAARPIGYKSESRRRGGSSHLGVEHALHRVEHASPVSQRGISYLKICRVFVSRDSLRTGVDGTPRQSPHVRVSECARARSRVCVPVPVPVPVPVCVCPCPCPCQCPCQCPCVCARVCVCVCESVCVCVCVCVCVTRIAVYTARRSSTVSNGPLCDHALCPRECLVRTVGQTVRALHLQAAHIPLVLYGTQSLSQPPIHAGMQLRTSTNAARARRPAGEFNLSAAYCCSSCNHVLPLTLLLRHLLLLVDGCNRATPPGSIGN